MRIAHLLASPFFGGPERQVLGFSQHLPASCQTLFLSFSEQGKARDFLARASRAGFESRDLESNWPRLLAAVREVTGHLREWNADILITSGYKSDLIGLLAARSSRIPVISIAHGWTGATRKVRWNEAINRRLLRFFNAVVGVSQAQTHKNLAAGIPRNRTHTISNAIDPARLAMRNQADRTTLESFFGEPAPDTIVIAAGRLSREKGFDILIEAAEIVTKSHRQVGFLVFGEGSQRELLEEQIQARGLQQQFVLGGFRNDLDSLIPQADLMALSSHTEGLPVIALEAMSAGLPVVATAVGGIPELIENSVQGLLVPPGESSKLAEALSQLVGDTHKRKQMGHAATQRINQAYTCQQQAAQFYDLAQQLIEARKQGTTSYSVQEKQPRYMASVPVSKNGGD